VLDNWAWSGIATLQSGVPQTYTLDNVTVIDATGSHSFSAASWSGSSWITATDASARVQVIKNTGDMQTMVIGPPPQGALGNAGRNLFRGPWLNNFDMALFKRVPLPTDRLNLEFRAEAYNVFNRTNFTTMDNRARFTIDTLNGSAVTQSNPTLGTFTAAYPKRRIQLGMRLKF